MAEQYKHVLDFTKENAPFEDWSFSIKSSLTGKKRRGGFGGGLEVMQNVRSKGERKINIDLLFKANSIIEGSVDVNVDEVVSIIWNRIFETTSFKKLLLEKGMRHEKQLLIRHLVPVEKGGNTSYVIILFHKDYTKRVPFRIVLDDKIKNEIIKELFPKKRDFENILAMTKEISFSKKSSVVNFALDKEIFSQIIQENVFQIVVYRYPELDYLSSTPNEGVGVGIKSQNYTSSIGVVAKDQYDKLGCTLCYHDFSKLSNFGVGTEVYVSGHQAIINSIDVLSDSCFAIFSNPNNALLTSEANNGPLNGVSPRAGEKCDFKGITSGVSTATVTSWDPSIPYIKPQSGLINMQKVYSTASVNPGDSGSALMDGQNYVIGFAAFRTGLGFPVPFAAWIWAETVFFAHEIS